MVEKSKSEAEVDDSTITNTTRVMNANPLLPLVLGMLDKDSGRSSGSFIEDQEAHGQQELASQTGMLPDKGSQSPFWAAMGVIFGDLVPDDRIWRKVHLPPGWRVVPTNHAMWSELRDARGGLRAKVFYKASFHDRSCHILPCPRYFISSDEETTTPGGAIRMVVVDGATGTLIFSTPFLASNLYRELTKASTSCEEFLKSKFPDYENPAAYWND